MVLADDLRQAWRSLAKTPGFLALAGSVLALGLAATIFMYAMIDTTIRKPPPFEEAERLIGMQAAEPARGNFDHDVQYLDYLEIRARQRTLEDMMGYYSGTMIVSGDGLPERYSGGFVTWNFMRVLRVKPLLGRDFTAEDDLPHAAPVAILGHDLWRARFGGDPRVVGRTVRVNSRASTIVGVAPPGFTFPGDESLWIPMARDPVKERRGSQDSIGVTAVGRLAPGTTFTQAADDLAAIAARLAADYPQTNAGTVLQVMPVPRLFVGRQGGQILYTMFAAVWLVLLIACANVASLIFVRANFRVYEASMRVALGARRLRLMMQMLAESVIVAGTGLLGGLALAAVGLYLIQQALAAMIDSPPAWWKFSIDPGIALFGAGAALLSGLLAGIVPAIRASRPNVMNILRDGGRTGTGLRLSRFTTTMVVVEIA